MTINHIRELLKLGHKVVDHGGYYITINKKKYPRVHYDKILGERAERKATYDAIRKAKLDLANASAVAAGTVVPESVQLPDDTVSSSGEISGIGLSIGSDSSRGTNEGSTESVADVSESLQQMLEEGNQG